MGTCGDQILRKPAHKGHPVSLTDKGSCQVKGSVAISDHRHLTGFSVNTFRRAEPFFPIAIEPGQNRQAAVHTFKRFSRHTQLPVRPGSDSGQYRLKILFEGRQVPDQIHGVGGFKLHSQLPNILKVAIQNFPRQTMGADAIA